MSVSRLFSSAGRCVLYALCVLMLAACHKTGDEAQIKHILDSMVTAIQSGNYSEVADHLHSDFRANNGMDVQQVKQMLMMVGMQHASLKITILSSTTEIDTVYTDRATSTLSVVETSGSSIAGLPSDGSARVVKLDWRKESNDWKIFHATWNE
jgi:nitrate reductase beta subunit